MARRRVVLAGALGSLTPLAGCPTAERRSSPTDGAPSGGDGATHATARRTVPSPATPVGRAVGYTHARPSGNRVLAGTGSLPDGSLAVGVGDSGGSVRVWTG